MFVGFCDTFSVSPQSSPSGSVWCLPCAAVAAAGNQRGKPIGLENISASVLLFVPRCPGELFSGVLVWSSYLDSLSSEQLLAPKLSSGWETRSRYCMYNPSCVCTLRLTGKAECGMGRGHGRDCMLTVQDFCSGLEGSQLFPGFLQQPKALGVLSLPGCSCGFGTAHQYPCLRSQRVILWCAVK